MDGARDPPFTAPFDVLRVRFFRAALCASSRFLRVLFFLPTAVVCTMGHQEVKGFPETGGLPDV